MTKLNGRIRLALALSVALFASAKSANAGLLQMNLTVGGSTFVISEDGPFDIATEPNTITVNTSALNTALAAAGFGNLSFSGLEATSNNPGDAVSATVGISGNAQVSSGTVDFSIVTFQTDFVLPVGPAGLLDNSSSVTFSNVGSGSANTFQSYFDPTNTGAPISGSMIASPVLTFVAPGGVGQNSQSGNSPLTGLGTISAPFALVNQLNVTLSGTANQVGEDRFTAGTTVTAIPEPASVVMMMSALPIAFGLVRSFRRGTKTIA